ncbi:MAG TPA: hypothetical protein VLQ93_08860 [Myxococcaceae bacterium]|nr:hypothetical protein [Myxococcaceae bacterium]
MRQEGRSYTYAAWGGVAFMAACLITTLADGRWDHAALVSGFLAASVAYLTFIHQLPREMDLLVILTCLANTYGWGERLLETVYVFDDIIHLLTTFTAALLLGLRLGQFLGAPFAERRALLWLFAASITLAGSVLWEFAEWVSNAFQPLEDPLPDLFFNTLGASSGAALAMRVLRQYPPGTWRVRHKLPGPP